MKTLINFKVKQPLRLCDQIFSNALYLLWQLPCAGAYYFLVKIQLKSYALMVALRICLDGLVARMTASRSQIKVAVKEGLSNKRLMVGLCVGLVAFPAWKCHLFFDMDQRIPDFYYQNWAFYFNTIRPYICGIFVATGFFIAAPQKWKFKWWALPVVVFCATEIYEESFYDDYTDFYNAMPAWQQMTLIIVSIVPFFFSVDYLVYRKYHLKDGNLARIIGLIKAPGLTADQKMVHLEKLAEECENFNARI